MIIIFCIQILFWIFDTGRNWLCSLASFSSTARNVDRMGSRTRKVSTRMCFIPWCTIWFCIHCSRWWSSWSRFWMEKLIWFQRSDESSLWIVIFHSCSKYSTGSSLHIKIWERIHYGNLQSTEENAKEATLLKNAQIFAISCNFSRPRDTSLFNVYLYPTLC